VKLFRHDASLLVGQLWPCQLGNRTATLPTGIS
jgi:hypothetical protein